MDGEASPRTGVLTPRPCYLSSNLSMVGLGAVTVPYDLCEERGWELRVEELHGALESAKGVCRPVALYVINPGNPTGSDASRGRGGVIQVDLIRKNRVTWLFSCFQATSKAGSRCRR